MDVAHPVRAVVPSLDGPVLVALAASTAPLTLAEVHRLAGTGSKAGVRRVLLRLVDAGLVLEEPGGYVLNRDHIAAPAVLTLASLHGELTRRVRATFEGWGDRVALAGFYGSVARRDGDEDSDIDILIVSDDDVADDVDELAETIRRWTGNDAHISVMTTAALRRLQRRKEPILTNWVRDLEVVIGDRRILQVQA